MSDQHEKNKNVGKWKSLLPEYTDLTNDQKFDSAYLRKTGLYPNVLDFVGDVSASSLLDVGTGTGWLFDNITPKESFACDVASEEAPRESVSFSVQDIRALDYPDNKFDVVVASLVLMWFSEILTACRQLCRVAKPKTGRLILALTHPYFHHTGSLADGGGYTISRSLSESFIIEGYRIGGKVGPLNYHYHPLDYYLTTLAEVGWKIRRVKDWYIDMDDYAEKNKFTKSHVPRTDRVPMYIFIECVKSE